MKKRLPAGPSASILPASPPSRQPSAASPATSPYLMGRSAVFVNGADDLSSPGPAEGGSSGGSGPGGKARRVSTDSDGWHIVE